MTITATYTSLGLATSLCILGVLALASTAEAYRGNPETPGPNCSPERQQAVEQAFTDNNYPAWQALMAGKGRVTQIVTAENFAQFAHAHALARSGELAEAKHIRQSLGLGVGQQKGDRAGAGNQFQQAGTHAYQRGS